MLAAGLAARKSTRRRGFDGRGGACWSAGPGWCYAGSGGGLGVQAVGEGGVAAAGALGADGGGQGAAGSG